MLHHVCHTEDACLASCRRQSGPCYRFPAFAQIATVIHTIRGQRVMLDSDPAALYGISTSA
jgi:hypothetical protein